MVPVGSPPVEDGTVAVDGHTIRYVGPRSGAPGGEDDDLGDVVLMPGLVNAHCHLELTIMRGFLEDLDFRRWILRLTAARRDVLSREMLLDSARLGIEEGIRAGITTYADTGESGLPMDAMIEAGVRGTAYLEVFGPDPSQCEDSIAGLRDRVAEHRGRETSLVRVGVSPHAPYTVSDALYRAVARFAVSEGLPMATHVAESAIESDLIAKGSGAFADGLRRRSIDVRVRGRSPIAMLHALGVLGAKPLLIHCVRVDGDDIKMIARTACPVAHCPASNAKLGHGIAPLVELMSAGVPVGLGSDSMASNNRMDLLEEARLALLMQRARLLSSETPSAADLLALATIGGARALGLADRIGTLEEGKEADLAAFPLHASRPTYEPASAAVFAPAGARAEFVAVAGRPLLRHGEICRPLPGLESRTDRAAAQLSQWLASDRELSGKGLSAGSESPIRI